MKIGLHIPDFTWQGGDAAIGRTLAEVARTADEAGFDRISVMDHFYQIRAHGPAEHAMLEAYTALGHIAAHTERATLLTLVTGVHYRHPGILAKQVTTLDVLSGGRAWLGIGAGWNEEESRGLGIPFPPLKDRFEMLEEAIQICLRMWSDDESPYEGKHYRLERPLNSPQALTKPHPPIMVGGSGEQKTLRLVAKYAQACNIFGGPELAHKLEVLRGHCEREGRDYADVEKTATILFDLGERGERVDEILARLKEMADLGVQVAHGKVVNAGSIEPLKLMAREIIPAAAEF
jgi:F420-dependent oxidoreductase-like protein